MKLALSALVFAAGLGFASVASAAPVPAGVSPVAGSSVEQVAMRRGMHKACTTKKVMKRGRTRTVRTCKWVKNV